MVNGKKKVFLRFFLGASVFLNCLITQGWASRLVDLVFEKPARLSSDDSIGLQLQRSLDVLRPEQQQKVSIPVLLEDSQYKNNRFLLAESSFDEPIKSHVFAVANFTFDMYEKDGCDMGNWIRLPLRILQGDKGKTAYHPSGGREIRFWGSEMSDFDYDVVAHEIGHAILDYLKPALNNYQNNFAMFQQQMLHEAFADVSSIFSSFKLALFLQDSQSISNLFARPLRVNALAPFYARSELGLRNPSIPQNFDDYMVRKDFHGFSQLITGILQESINIVLSYEYQERGRKDFSAYDLDFAENLRKVFVHSFIRLNARSLSITKDFLDAFENGLISSYSGTSIEGALRGKISRTNQIISQLFQ